LRSPLYNARRPGHTAALAIIHVNRTWGERSMNAWPILLAQNEGEVGGVLGIFCACFFWLLMLAVVIVGLVGLWKIFEKAGQPGWAAIIPYYNLFVLNQIAGKDILWFVLAIIPCVQIVAIPVICMDVAKNFGKDPIFGLGLAFLTPIFAPLLGFSDAKYQGPAPKQF
jgi:hypothetical protein